MKIRFFAYMIAAVLLFPCCSSDEEPANKASGKGTLMFGVAFDEREATLKTTRAASTAIPVTGWDNISQVQVFLYEQTRGKVMLSDVIQPSAGQTQFSWTGVPPGNYDLALVANVQSNTDPVTTYVDGITPEAFTTANVIGKTLNEDIYIDLKRGTFPSGHTFQGHKKAFQPVSEIFTAYAENLQIHDGDIIDTGTLKLTREVALMRIRINKSASFLNEPGREVDFAHPSNFIAIHRMPNGFGIKTPHTNPAFLGGIFANPDESDADKIMIVAEGAQTFRTTNPSGSAYSNPVIIDSDFTLWRDVTVFPNVAKTNPPVSAGAEAADNRKYFVVISAWAPAGYKPDDGAPLSGPAPVYWSAPVNGVFSPNVIREVNLTIAGRGSLDNPVDPENRGTLQIELGEPEDWTIVTETINKI